MKKIVMFVLVFALACPTLFAAQRGTAEYEKLKELKKAQRAQKSSQASGAAAQTSKAPGFWDREAERSGLKQWGSSNSSFIAGLNPVAFLRNQEKRYNDRKAAAVK